ncbi:hypothetical protein, partial [Aeromonas caviae]|uniref:hypothetical protein n=1 Tax=Aeromonas caviae TaxID=648 RepID=UPI002B474066
LHAETALGTGRMTSTFECSKKWGDYRGKPLCSNPARVLTLPLCASGNTVTQMQKTDPEVGFSIWR